MSVRIFAPAKINLTLKVGVPRADGLHPLASVVVFADVGDWIIAERATNTSLRVEGAFAAQLQDEKDNLVLRAADALSRATGVTYGASLTLEKNLPIASGIGGGSSDAAATLKALNILWKTELDEDRLIEISRTLGSDVPVCVAGTSAYMTGAGEAFVAIDAPELDAVMFNPLKPLPTPAVYRQFDAMALGSELSPGPPTWGSRAEAIAGAAALGNDLAVPARVLMPEIVRLEAKLRQHRGVHFTSISGSGATVFALVDERNAALDIAARLEAEESGWWVRAVRLNPRA